MVREFGRRAAFGLSASALAAQGARAQGRPGAIRGRDGWLFLEWDDPANVDLTNMPRISGLLRDATALIRGKGIDVAFVVLPSKYRIYRDMLPPGHGYTQLADQRLALVLQELRGGSPLVPDLAAPLLERRRSAPQDQLFFKADTHWTPTGAAVTAAEMARQIRATIRLPASRAPGTRLGPPTTETRLRADLREFLPVADRAAYPNERFTIRPAVAARGGLLDTAASDVAIIGNSFMAPEFNFHAELSAGLERPVSLEWKIQTIGPFKTMVDYLASPLFRREKPKLILWTLLEGVMNLNPENRGAYPQSHMTGAAFLDGIRQALAAA